MKIRSGFILWLILASGTLTVMAGAVIAPVLNSIRDGLGVDPASAGLVITTHGLFVALFSPLMGIIIDRAGAKRPFVFALVLYGLVGGSGLYITSYWILIISRAIFGIAVAAVIVSITVTILSLYQGAERNKIMGWRSSANAFGGVIWPLIGGALGVFSWHLPFAVYLLGIPLGFFAWLAMPEVPQGKSQEASEEGSVWQVFRNNLILLAVYGLMFLTMVLLYVIVVFLPQLLERIGVSNPFYISLYLSAMALSGGLTSLMYGRIKSRLSYKKIVLIALALWAVGFATISQAFPAVLFPASVVLIGIGQGMVFPTVMLWVGEMVPASFRGRIISYLGTFGFIGQFLSPIIFAPVLLLLGLNGVFLVAGGVCALVFLLFLAAMRK